MKKVLEAVVVLAAFALGVFVLRQWRARADAAAHPGPSVASTRPGTDVEGEHAPPTRPPHAGAVSALPMIKLASPPRAPKRSGAVPAPAKP